jgi:CDP-diacylglycerol--serine O-phosphatidyltransferase
MIKKNLANYFSLLNLLSGVFAIVFIFHSDYKTALLLVLAGIFFDFIDGLVARMTGTSSELGLQLDSLADLVTSGLVPSYFLYLVYTGIFPGSFLPYLFLIIAAASAWRLAKFNIDSNQKKHFIGLATPANALFLLATGMILVTESQSFVGELLKHPWTPVLLTLLSSWLLNAPLPLLSLKISSGNKKPNLHIIVLLLVSLALIVFLKYKSALIILPLYIIFSLHYFKTRPS